MTFGDLIDSLANAQTDKAAKDAAATAADQLQVQLYNQTALALQIAGPVVDPRDPANPVVYSSADGKTVTKTPAQGLGFTVPAGAAPSATPPAAPAPAPNSPGAQS